MMLEIGCGKNRFPGADVAIDINRESLCDIVADAQYLPFRDGVFIKVVMYEVLEHITDATRALSEINRVLVKSGELELSIPNAMYWRAILRWIIKGKISASPEHINCWRLPEAENLLRKTRFNLTKVDFIDTHFHKPSIFARIFPRITRHSMLIKAIKP
ncbi:class I SAM-dependent methyltransferase [Candidatus Bathyarchaeota archaeon]|nr:class I SAM-dependent methyltransferase [Candidatus Bathyarchaeota archaeon]